MADALLNVPSVWLPAGGYTGDAWRVLAGTAIAVALDWGLIVPVLKNAEEKNFLGLARGMNDLAERARAKKLKPEEVQEGTFSITNPGVYGGLIDKFPMGLAMNKGLTFKMGQTNVHKYLRPLLKLIQDGKIDPSFVITHRLNLSDAASGYSTFKKDRDDCIKVVMKPELN